VDLRRQHTWLCSTTIPCMASLAMLSFCRAVEWSSGPEAAAHLAAWKQGRTGFPLVDAGELFYHAEDTVCLCFMRPYCDFNRMTAYHSMAPSLCNACSMDAVEQRSAAVALLRASGVASALGR
jgi:hypothetical protein